MSSKIFWLLPVFFVLMAVPKQAHASPEEDQIKSEINNFYKTYLQLEEKFSEQPNKGNREDPSEVWVKENSVLTDELKQAYKSFMSDEELDHDPILDAQDVPSKPFETKGVDIHEDTATATVMTSDWPDHFIHVRLVKKNEKWFIDAINELNQKEEQP